jgi:very-short-patch-repair endonuclease
MSHPSHQRRMQLEVRAREMRLSPTLSELRLWQALQGSRLGVGFRRAVGHRRVHCRLPGARGAAGVEVDGACHARRCRADAGRDQGLEHRGIACCVSRSKWSRLIWRARWRSS